METQNYGEAAELFCAKLQDVAEACKARVAGYLLEQQRDLAMLMGLPNQEMN